MTTGWIITLVIVALIIARIIYVKRRNARQERELQARLAAIGTMKPVVTTLDEKASLAPKKTTPQKKTVVKKVVAKKVAVKAPKKNK